MLKTKMITPFALTLAAATFGLAPATYAGSQHSNQHQIRYVPAELSTPKKAEAILLRIHDTANHICWEEFGPIRHGQKLKLKMCLEEVTQDLVGQINHPNLDAAQARIPTPEKLKRKTVRTKLALTEIDMN